MRIVHEVFDKATDQTKEQYVIPDIEIVEVETSQNILNGSTNLPGVGDGGGAW